MPRLRVPMISVSDAPDGSSALGRRRADPPSWRDVLGAVEREVARGRPEARELLYAIDLDATAGEGKLVIVVCEEASWLEEKFRIATMYRSDIGGHLDPEDAAILGALEQLGGSSYAHASTLGPLGPRFVLRDGAEQVIPRICATGRARLTRGLDGLDGPPLAWDEGDAYGLVLDAAMDAHGELSVGATLARGSERVSVHAPSLVVAGGLVFFPDRVAFLDDDGHFAWIATIRGTGRLSLAAGDVAALVERLRSVDGAPPLELPPEHAFVEVRVTPRPFVILKSPREGTDDDAAWISLFFDYDGIRAHVDHPGRVVVDRTNRRILLRDQEVEEAARERLASNGVRPPRGRDNGWYRLAPKRILTAARAFVAAGWRVEVDGRTYRAAHDLRVAVTSGIDWFDVRLRGDFDGVELPLTELLAAVRHRRSTLVLADGSIGLLEDAWFDRVERWAAMATPENGALRFKKTQVAVLAALADREPTLASDDLFATQRAELAAFAGIEPKDAPYGFRGALRPYQRDALGWFAFLRRFGFGGCLADDMGLGKTVQVVALLEERRLETPHPGPSLIVVPRSLLFHWTAEIARFAPELRVLLHDGTGRARDELKTDGYDVVVATYGTLKRDAEMLANVAWDYVVLDEAQAIKNAKSGAAVAARVLPGRHRLALTGTPVENHLGELASIFAFLNPGMLGGATALRHLASGARTLDEPGRAVLAQAMRPVVLRRTKGQVARDLPERVEQTIVCDLGRSERQLYDEIRAHARASIARRIGKHGVVQSTMHILEALLRLRQAACHPGLVDAGRRTEDGAKIEALMGHLESVAAEGRKALVFSQFTTLLRIVRDRLDAREISYEYLDGATKDRAARVARFQEDPGCAVFLLSLKAGGVGLNLTAADCVFLLDPWWNPAAEAQAIDRAHRIGQRRTVFAYRILARNTVEEKVAELQRTKRALADALFAKDSAPIEGMSRDDLELLLS